LRIGILSFHFYNMTAEGLATAQVAQALIDRGHEVIVFTSRDNPLYGSYVRATDGPLSGIAVHRVGANFDLAPRWWRVVSQMAKRNVVWDKVAAIPNLAYGCSLEEWSWVQGVTSQVVRVWTDAPFDVLHTRLNHHISHLAGLEVISQIPKLAWCAYFSDPWPHHLYPAPYQFTVGPASRRRSEILLDRILERAGSYLFPSERLRDHMLSGKREHFLKKALVAPHLTTRRAEIRPPDSADVLKIRHSGFLMRERKIDPLFEGLRAFLARRPDAAERIAIEFAGRYTANGLPQAPADLCQVVRFHPYMNAEAIWDWLQDANIFLLVEAKMREGIFLPSKLADYLGGARPILALSPMKGVVADLLKEGGGIIVEPDDVNGIGLALERLYDLWGSHRLAELTPRQSQIDLVSPDKVIPVYERAFHAAIEYQNQ
jgi:glycosyltransferase involved in cell wall biosynthesis